MASVIKGLVVRGKPLNCNSPVSDLAVSAPQGEIDEEEERFINIPAGEMGSDSKAHNMNLSMATPIVKRVNYATKKTPFLLGCSRGETVSPPSKQSTQEDFIITGKNVTQIRNNTIAKPKLSSNSQVKSTPFSPIYSAWSPNNSKKQQHETSALDVSCRAPSWHTGHSAGNKRAHPSGFAQKGLTIPRHQRSVSLPSLRIGAKSLGRTSRGNVRYSGGFDTYIDVTGFQVGTAIDGATSMADSELISASPRSARSTSSSLSRKQLPINVRAYSSVTSRQRPTNLPSNLDICVNMLQHTQDDIQKTEERGLRHYQFLANNISNLKNPYKNLIIDKNSTTRSKCTFDSVDSYIHFYRTKKMENIPKRTPPQSLQSQMYTDALMVKMVNDINQSPGGDLETAALGDCFMVSSLHGEEKNGLGGYPIGRFKAPANSEIGDSHHRTTITSDEDGGNEDVFA